MGTMAAGFWLQPSFSFREALRRGVRATFVLAALWASLGRADAAEWRLAGVEAEGLQSLTVERIVALSGLTVGQPVAETDLQAAAQRLIDSGFFRTITYRYRYQGENLTAIFVVEEGETRVPVVFDNFVWLGDEELRGAVRSQMRHFDGTAPPVEESRRAIVDGLRVLLHEKDIRTQIRYEAVSDPRTGQVSEMVFRADVDLPICDIRFPHTQSAPEPALRERSRGLLGQNYSRRKLLAFAEKNLLPLFHAAGRLRAEFLTPTARLLDNDECPTGVAVSLPVAEGAFYTWAQAEWSGATLFTEEELNRTLGMSRGETADAGKIEAGLQAIRKAYAAKGRPDVKIEVSPLFDADLLSVTYRVSIVE